jgi:hypothetical protein
VVLDGVTPRTITKYLSNFYEEQAGNKTYFNASWVTGCQLLGSIPDEAGQNPFDLKWAIYDNIPGPVKLEVLLKAPGSSDFEPFLDETDQSEGGIVASKRTLRISEGNLEMVKKKQGATYTFRVRATDGRGNVTQLPDYPVTVNLLWGPAHFYALAVPATDPNSGPSNALDGGSLFRPSLGSASNRIAVRYHVIHNRTAETLYSGVRNISWTTPTGTARWARTTDRSYRVQDSCPALGAINWPAQEVDQPFETPRPLSFALVTGTPLNPSKSAFAVDKYSSAVMTLQQPGLSELPGSDIRTGYSPARQIFAQQESQVDTECTNIIEHTGDLCSNEADCVGNGGCDEAEGYCYVIRKRVTTIHRLWALVSLHMFSQGDVYREVSFDGTTWEPHGGADSLWHSLDRTHTEDWAPL